MTEGVNETAVTKVLLPRPYVGIRYIDFYTHWDQIYTPVCKK
jgi:hypothetical protein